MTEKRVSSAMEDYLKAIFEHGERNVKSQTLAAELAVSAASVTGMLKKLAELNLVEYERYRGVSLTSTGRKMALEILRHHRLIETYLAQALGYAWHEVHDEAEKLEHHISEDFELRIAEALQNPTHDPHGDPIPRQDGSLPDSPGVPLNKLEVGETARITRITNQDREVLRYLAEKQLVPGIVITVSRREPFNGPLTLTRQDGDVTISSALSEAIHATPLAMLQSA